MEEFELEPGEEITRSVRRHWIVLLGNLLPYLIFAVLPLLIPVAIAFIGNSSPTIANSLTNDFDQAGPWFTLFLGFWWLFLWISAFSVFTRYFLTIWVITTTRIVDIHQYGFFSRQVSSFLLSRVQDVTTDVEGFFPTILGFGTLNVETAGHEEKFVMNGIENPTELRDLIMREVALLDTTSSKTALEG